VRWGGDRRLEILRPPLEALDPLEQRTRVIVGLGVGEAGYGNLERDPSVQRVTHGDYGRS
jgi:hypothetical protein